MEFDKIFDEKNICLAIQFRSSNSYSLFPHRNLLCCGNNFSNITFIQKSLSHGRFSAL